MAFFTDTITIYNYYQNPSTGVESWNRSVIVGVQWQHANRQIKVTNGLVVETVNESLTFDFRKPYFTNKQYVDPIIYKNMPIADVINCWTLNHQDKMDIIVLGEIDQEITADYGISKLKNNFQYTGIVSQVSDNRNRPRLKNIKVVIV